MLHVVIDLYPVVVSCGDSQPVSVTCRDVINTLCDNEHQMIHWYDIKIWYRDMI